MLKKSWVVMLNYKLPFTFVSLSYLFCISCSLLNSVSYADEIELIEFNDTFLKSDVDISYFAQGNPVPPGSYDIDVYLNDRWQGRKTFNFILPTQSAKIAIPCYDINFLESIGVDIEQLNLLAQAKLRHGLQCIPINELVTGAKGTYDSSNQRLNIIAPQAVLKKIPRGYVNPNLWDDGITSGTLQYNYNIYRLENSHFAPQTSHFLGLRGGINWDAWRVRYRASSDWINEGSFSFHNNETYIERGLAPIHSRLTIGKSNTDGQLFNSIGFIGAQLRTDDRMYPDSLRGFAPVVRGIANSNALVTISQRGNQIFQTTVPPGPFVIDDLFPTGRSGDLLVTIKEADGSLREFTVNYASIAELLRPGTTRYSLMSGKYKNNAVHAEPIIGMGTLRHGFSNLITGYGGIIGMESYSAVSGGMAFNTKYGALSIDLTHSQTQLEHQNNKQGQSLRFTYAKILPVIDTNVTLASYRYSDSGYYDINDSMLLRERIKYHNYNILDANLNRRSRLQLSVNQVLPNGYGAFSLNASTQDYWNRQGNDTEYQINYNNQFSYFNIGVNADRTRNLLSAYWDNRFVVTLSIPLGSSGYAPNLSTSYTKERNRQAFQTTLSGVAGDDRQYSYSSFIITDHNKYNRNNLSSGVSGTWAAPSTTLGANYSNGNDYSQYGASLSGGIIAYHNGIVFTPLLGDTSAIVEAEFAEGARVTNYVGLRLNNSGKAIVPYLNPYRKNTIELDPKGISSDVELIHTNQNVAPTAGAVALLKYETKRGYSILLTSKNINGHSLPFGASVLDENMQNVGYIGQAGQGLIRVNNEKGVLVIKWGEKTSESCKFSYQLPLLKLNLSDYRRLDIICL